MKNFISSAIIFTCFASSAFADSSWMGRIDDGVLLHQLSIPGSHDAGTGNGTALDSFAKTQELTLADQFKAGIRSFDLRPSVDGDQLRIYHGIIATDITFAEAIEELCGCLDENPSEFIIVIMRHEDDHENDIEKESWGSLISDYLTSDALSSRVVDFNKSLTLGDVRGKILFISRDKYATEPMGAYVSGWSHSQDFDSKDSFILYGDKMRNGSQLYVQDFYATHDALDKKVESIHALYDFSSGFNTGSGSEWAINHTSGYDSSFIASQDSYRKNAAVTNGDLATYIATCTQPGPAGIVVMDFAGVDVSGDYEVNGKRLTETVIASNFRYEKRGDRSDVRQVSFANGIKIENRKLLVSGEWIDLFYMDGKYVTGGYESVEVSAPGIFIVKVGNQVMKWNVL